MSKSFSPEEGREMLKLLNRNRWMLLDLYKINMLLTMLMG